MNPSQEFSIGNSSSSNSNSSANEPVEQNRESEEEKNKKKRRRKIEEQPLEVKTWIFKQEKLDDKQKSPMPSQSPRSASSSTGYDFWKENYQQTSSNERTAIKRERILVGQLPNNISHHHHPQSSWDPSPASTSANASQQSEMIKSKSYEIFHWQLEKPSANTTSPTTSPPFQQPPPFHTLQQQPQQVISQTVRQSRGSHGTEQQEDYSSSQSLVKQQQEEITQLKQENHKLKSQIEILMKLQQQQQQMQTSQFEYPSLVRSAPTPSVNMVSSPFHLQSTKPLDFPLPNLNSLYPPTPTPSLISSTRNNPSTASTQLSSIQSNEAFVQQQQQREEDNKQSHR